MIIFMIIIIIFPKKKILAYKRSLAIWEKYSFCKNNFLSLGKIQSKCSKKQQFLYSRLMVSVTCRRLMGQFNQTVFGNWQTCLDRMSSLVHKQSTSYRNYVSQLIMAEDWSYSSNIREYYEKLYIYIYIYSYQNYVSQLIMAEDWSLFIKYKRIL